MALKPWLEPVFDDLLHIGSRIGSIDPYLFLVRNRKTGFYEVHDRHPKVHPNHTMVMRIQKPDGTFRNPGLQDLAELHKLKQQTHKEMYDELGRIEEAREREWAKRDSEIQIAMANDLKWAGKAVVSSLAWRARAANPRRVA